MAWRYSVARARFFCLLRHTGRLAAACLYGAQAFLARPHPNCAPGFFPAAEPSEKGAHGRRG